MGINTRELIMDFILIYCKVLFLIFAIISINSETSNAESINCQGNVDNRFCYINNTKWGIQNAGMPWSIQAVSMRNSSNLRFEVRGGDVSLMDQKNHHVSERSEIYDAERKLPFNKFVSLSFDLLVEPGPKTTSSWNVIGQLHATEDPGDLSLSPIFAEEFDAGDVFKIFIRSSTQKPMRSYTGQKLLYSDSNFMRNRFYHFKYCFYINPSYGHLKAWKDSKLIVSYDGPFGYLDKIGPYAKFGIYRSLSTETFAIHYNNIKLNLSAPECTL